MPWKRRFFQIVNCSPRPGRGQGRAFLPRSLAAAVISFFLAPPKEVPDFESAGHVAPVWGALHQFCQLIIRFSVIFEALRPKVTRITHHNFSPVKKERMIVSGPGRKPRFQRHFAHGIGNRIDFAALGKSETPFSNREPAEQTDKSRSKQPSGSVAPTG